MNMIPTQHYDSVENLGYCWIALDADCWLLAAHVQIDEAPNWWAVIPVGLKQEEGRWGLLIIYSLYTPFVIDIDTLQPKIKDGSGRFPSLR